MQSTAKLTEDSAERLGIPAGAIDVTGFEPTLEGPAKSLIDIPALAPGRMRCRLKIGAVVAPSLPSASSRLVAPATEKLAVSPDAGVAAPVLRRISAAEGLRAVAPSTIVQSGFAGGAALAALAQLVREVPSYALELSPDPTANAAAIDRVAGELA
jgi:hypothetical protein